jgi:hypothetical protein
VTAAYVAALVRAVGAFEETLFVAHDGGRILLFEREGAGREVTFALSPGDGVPFFVAKDASGRRAGLVTEEIGVALLAAWLLGTRATFPADGLVIG